jgi:hypothetical protein
VLTSAPGEARPLPAAPERRHPGRVARLWLLPLWAHAAALAAVLMALVAVTGTGSSFSADEGAAIVQARHLAKGQGWVVDHPLPQADPTGRNYPLELSTRGPRGTAPFVKHPLYALLLAGADRLGGITAMVLLSVAGTVVAAALGGALAARLGAGLTRPALWVVGLASPLLFDGYLVIAHTLAAALATAAVVSALRALEGRPPPAAAAAAGACVAAAALLRNEAAFWGLGLGVVAGALALRRRSGRGAALAVAVAAPVAALGAHVGEQAWIDEILSGHAVPLGGASLSTTGLLGGRLRSLALTWLRPCYPGHSVAGVLLMVMLAAVVVGVVAARRRPARSDVAVVGAVAAGAAAGALAVAPANVVPGLLAAFPLAAAGLAALDTKVVQPLAGRLAVGSFALFALAVAATQYPTGGSGEWGGRYFALGLPVLVPVLLAALGSLGSTLDRSARRVAAAGLVACSLAMTAMALSSLRHVHEVTGRLTAAVDRAGAVTGADRPVVVATRGAVPRLAWATFDRQRWLLSTPGGLADVGGRLRGAGIARIVVVTDQPARDRAALAGLGEVMAVDRPVGGHDWEVLVIGLR